MVRLAPGSLDSPQQAATLVRSDRSRTKWMALRTRSRQEKAVARCASALKLSCYLPLMKRVSIIRRRRFISEVPVFPGYVFMVGEIEDTYEQALSRRICQVIAIADQDRFIHELEQIKRVLAESVPLQLHPFAVAGRCCRVVRGPLAGLEGVIEELKNGLRLILQVDIIGRGVALEIDVDMLEPID